MIMSSPPKITNFFKRKTATLTENESEPTSIRPDVTEIDDGSSQNPPKKPKTASSSEHEITTTCQQKTLKKWIHELHVDIGYKLKTDEKGNECVCMIWCELCKEHSTDRSSSVSKHSLMI